MDAVAATGILGNAQAVALPGAGPAVQAADALATARFSEIMNAQPAALAEALQAAYPQEWPAGGRTLGDTILSGMQSLSTEFQQSWKTVNAVLEGGNAMNSHDLLKLQMGLTQLAIQYELVGKAISRSTQNLDQLLKMQ